MSIKEFIIFVSQNWEDIIQIIKLIAKMIFNLVMFILVCTFLEFILKGTPYRLIVTVDKILTISVISLYVVISVVRYFLKKK